MKIEKKIEIPQELISSLKQATRVAVLTGAGISAESGLKTFRDAHPSTSTGQGSGHWSQYRPEIWQRRRPSYVTPNSSGTGMRCDVGRLLRPPQIPGIMPS
jgi:hypothetical protein